MRLQATTNSSQADVQTIRTGLSNYNLAQVPALLQLPYDELVVVVRNEHGDIIGGVIAEFDWGYLFFDTVWVDGNERGKGLATRIMAAAESYAASRGIQRAYLATTTFQAKPFYEKIGYQVYGAVHNQPPDHTMYYLWKDKLTTVETDLEVQSPPNPDDLNWLNQALVDDIARHVPLGVSQYAVFLRDDAGLVHGGLWGNFYWNWFDLRFLWMSDIVRGQGFGKQAMHLLIDECKRRGCIGIKCDTTDFQSLAFYQSLGFEVYGTLQDRPPQHTSYFIQKLTR